MPTPEEIRDGNLQALQSRDDEIERLRQELGRAYRAIQGLWNARVNHTPFPEGYHAPTIAAARRFITDDSLEGAAYFEGKQVDVLHEVLKSYRL